MKNQTVRTITIVMDLILINLAFVLAYVARYEWEWLLPVVYPEPYLDYVSQQIILTFLLILTFSQHKVWRRRRGESWIDEMSRITSATASGVALMMVFTFFFQPVPFSRLLLVWALVFIVVLHWDCAFDSGVGLCVIYIGVANWLIAPWLSDQERLAGALSGHCWPGQIWDFGF